MDAFEGVMGGDRDGGLRMKVEVWGGRDGNGKGQNKVWVWVGGF